METTKERVHGALMTDLFNGQKAINSQAQAPDNKVKAEIVETMGLDPAEVALAEKRNRRIAEARKPLTDDELKVCWLMGVEPLEYWTDRVAEAEKGK